MFAHAQIFVGCLESDPNQRQRMEYAGHAHGNQSGGVYMSSFFSMLTTAEIPLAAVQCMKASCPILCPSVLLPLVTGSHLLHDLELAAHSQANQIAGVYTIRVYSCPVNVSCKFQYAVGIFPAVQYAAMYAAVSCKALMSLSRRLAGHTCKAFMSNLKHQQRTCVSKP